MKVALGAAAGGWAALRESFFCQRSSCVAGGEVYQHRDHHSYPREALSLPHCCQLHLGQFRGVQMCLHQPQCQLCTDNWAQHRPREEEWGQRAQMGWQKLSWGVSCLLLVEMNLRKGCVLMWEHLHNTHTQNHRIVWAGKGSVTAVNPALPDPPLKHVPQCHAYTLMCNN